MTNTPKKTIVDCSTGIVTEVDFTAEELAQMEVDRLAYEAQQAADLAEQERIASLKDSAKRKLVAGEKLTADEAALLIG